MRRMLFAITIVCIVISALTAVARLIGFVQPMPTIMSALYLDQCPVGCWLGLYPGRATINATRHTLYALRGEPVPPSSPQNHYTGSEIITIPLKGDQTSNLLSIGLGINEGITTSIFIPYPNYNLRMPRLGDLVGMYGPPDCVLWVKTNAILSYFVESSDTQISISLDGISRLVSWNQHVTRIIVSQLNTLDCEIFSRPWRGLSQRSVRP
jgi:hypothetical protein